MNRSIIFTVAGFTAFFFILYFGCDVRTHEKNQPQAVRDKIPESVDFENLIVTATAKLNDTLRSRLQNLTQLAKASSQASTLKLLSSAWHDAGNDAKRLPIRPAIDFRADVARELAL